MWVVKLGFKLDVVVVVADLRLERETERRERVKRDERREKRNVRGESHKKKRKKLISYKLVDFKMF